MSHKISVQGLRACLVSPGNSHNSPEENYCNIEASLHQRRWISPLSALNGSQVRNGLVRLKRPWPPFCIVIGAIGFLGEYALCNRYFEIMRVSPYGLKRQSGYDDEPIRTTNDFGRSSIRIGRCRKRVSSGKILPAKETLDALREKYSV